MLTVKESITQLLEQIRLGIIEDQEDKNIRASGASAKSLKYKVKEVSGNITGTLVGYNYFYWQEYGRSPGTLPPIEAIKKWIKAKGIKPVDISETSLAWAIAKKIQKSGTRAKRNESPRLAVAGIIQDTMDANRDQIRKAMFNQFKTDVGKTLKTSFE